MTASGTRLHSSGRLIPEGLDEAMIAAVVDDFYAKARIDPLLGPIFTRVIPQEVWRAHQIEELEREPREQLTPLTKTAIADLLEELEQAKRAGFAVVDQESIVGLTAMAAPVFGSNEMPIAAVSVASASSARPISEFVNECRDDLITASRDLSQAMQAAGGLIGDLSR